MIRFSLFIIAEVKKIVNMMNKQEYEVDEDANQRDWQMVSRIVDRICMIIFFIISIVLVAGYIIDLSIRINMSNDDDFE